MKYYIYAMMILPVEEERIKCFVKGLRTVKDWDPIIGYNRVIIFLILLATSVH